MTKTEQRTVEEAYASAMSSTNLKLDPSTHGDADVLIAAGWSPSRIGAALIRLQSEWDSAAHPRTLQRADFEKPGARDLADKAHAQHLANTANEQEARLLFAKLKTLTTVQTLVAYEFRDWGTTNPVEKSSAIVRWWLQKHCEACNCTGFVLKTGKACKRCALGEKRPPLGEEGKRLANFMDDCVHAARHTIGRALRQSRS